ncbi:MAG: carbohydrate kinase family protein [Actinomycetota bacterium]|nr:carbohydrate kinase family protein [Actinomycetota bacterium]
MPARRSDVVVVGDVMLDVAVASPQLARGGDVHGTVRVRPGGSAANAAVWAAWAGASVRLYGRVGDDEPGAVLELALRKRGVEVSLARGPGERTGTMLIVVEGGERSMVADRGANAGLRADDLPAEIDAGAVLVSGYALLHPPTTEAAAAAIRRARADHIAVDAASWPLLTSGGSERLLDASRGATLLLANEREADALAGLEGEDSIRRLARRYACVVVKRGERGAVVARDGALEPVGSPSVDELDPTGAGDAFDGVLLSHLARGGDLLEAAAAACRAGARVAASEDTWPEE